MLLSTAVAAAEPPALPDDLGARFVAGYIAPATARFAAAGHDMTQALDAWCRAGRPAQAAPVREGFTALVDAWAGVEFLRFGPLVQNNRFERVFFWPDPRGVTLRSTQGVLAKRDAALLEPGALRAQSVAVQGLPALEFALFGGDDALLGTPAPAAADEAADFRCRYAAAVAANVASLGDEVAAAWGKGGEAARHFSQPGPDNPLYRSPAEVAAEAVKAMSGGVQFIRDAKLMPALGAAPEAARATRAPLARSDATLEALAAGVQGIGAFYAAARLGEVFGEFDRWLAAVVTVNGERIAGELRGIDVRLEDALREPVPRARLTNVAVELADLKDMIDGQIASALGVRVGFNALDGD